MPIRTDVIGVVGPPVEVSWARDDCLLYALGVGAGALDPTGFELEFTTENSSGVLPRALPTFPVVLPLGVMAVFDRLGPFDFAKLLHGEQRLELHRPVPVEGSVWAEADITAIYDKGSAAVVVFEIRATDAASGKAMFTLGSSLFIRGEGGWGGERGPSTQFSPPDRAPDHRVGYATRSDQSLLYRLNGDRNPLHSDPKVAAAAGFERPILHGLCAFGFTGRALLHTLCGSDPDRFGSIGGRFSKPVLPGAELITCIWETGPNSAIFQTITDAGDVVIDAGQFRFSPA